MWVLVEIFVSTDGETSANASEEVTEKEVNSIIDASRPFRQDQAYHWHSLYRSDTTFLCGYYGGSSARLNLYLKS